MGRNTRAGLLDWILGRSVSLTSPDRAANRRWSYCGCGHMGDVIVSAKRGCVMFTPLTPSPPATPSRQIAIDVELPGARCEPVQRMREDLIPRRRLVVGSFGPSAAMPVWRMSRCTRLRSTACPSAGSIAVIRREPRNGSPSPQARVDPPSRLLRHFPLRLSRRNGFESNQSTGPTSGSTSDHKSQ
jgi:hypothetical protein